MRKTDIKALSKQGPDVLARMWCQLNAYYWPPEIPYPEHPDVSWYALHLTRRGQIMKWIEDAIGHRRISREWNKDMSADEFEDFWRGNYEGNRKAYARYMCRLILLEAEEE